MKKFNNTKDNKKYRAGNSKNNDKKRDYSKPDKSSGINCGVHNSGTNDPAWYAKNPQLVKDVASFPFGMPVGSRLTLSVGPNTAYRSFEIPGVMNIKYIPTIDVGGDEATPINVAATNLYAFIRQANSGAKNYDPADLIQYILALDSLYTLHAEMKRLYGIANAYTPTNKYYSRGVIYALGYDPDEVYANMAQLRALVNLSARQLASYRLPSNLTYITRHQWMSSGMFTDSVSAKAQTYLFQCHAYWKYSNTDETGTKLSLTNMEMEGFGNGLVADLATLWNGLYQPLQNDEDVGIISGDILKAFSNNILNVAEIPESYTVIPAYDERVLMQIHNSNSVVLPDTDEIVESTIVQDPDVNEGHLTMNLVLGDYDSNLYYSGGPTRLLNYYKGNVTPDDVMEATRLASYADKPTSSSSYTMQVCGSEVVLWYEIVSMNRETFHKVKLNNVVRANHLDGLRSIGYISQFDWAPITYVLLSEDVTEFSLLADVDTYTIITEEELEMMHRVALLSEFEYY